MIKKILLPVFAFFVATASFSQGFTFVDAGMVSVGRSSVAWGDYDNDGDLDALITGDHGTGPYVAAVYRNDAGIFININAGLTGIYNSAVAWGDYDNDGDLDIVACGRNSTDSKTYIYKNNNGSFLRLEAGLPDIGSDGAVAWGDYDGDGDLDLLIAGAYSCRIYNNNAGAFADINAGLPLVSNCWVDWGDFDNDGDLDVFVMGDRGGILISAIYRNTEGVFTEMPQAGIVALAGGSSAWYDYDQDRDLDLLITGFNENLEPQTTIYRNMGNMEFVDTYPGLIGASLGTAAWGDYNNDGKADILLSGQNAGCGILSSLVYRNDGNNQFTDINAPLDGAERGSAAWGDYNNDGYLDILVSGVTGAGTPGTRLYSNNAGSNVFSPNLPPSIPDGQSIYIDRHHVTLGWNNSTDDHTPMNGITYNLQITSDQGFQIVPSMSNPANGKRLLPQAGNMGNSTDWLLNLPDGNYFWRVQAVDHAFAASAFSMNYMFTILNVGINNNDIAGLKVFPNPVSDVLLINADKPFECEISSLDGKVIEKVPSEWNKLSLSTVKWTPGIYTVSIICGDQKTSHKVIKK